MDPGGDIGGDPSDREHLALLKKRSIESNGKEIGKNWRNEEMESKKLVSGIVMATLAILLLIAFIPAMIGGF